MTRPCCKLTAYRACMHVSLYASLCYAQSPFAGCTLEALWEQWHEGIALKDGTRSAPLKVLERPQLRKVWRTEGLKGLMCYRKALIYAVHRRVHGFARQKGEVAGLVPLHSPMSVGEAIAELQATPNARGKSQTLTELSRNLGEMAPKEYEDAYGELVFI